MEQISCACFDLECTNLNADFGVILCGVVKGAGQPAKVFRADKLNKKWATKRSDDSAVLMAIVEELDKYDIWVAHNGAKFDVPWLRSRMLRHGLGLLPTKKLVDPVQLARNKLKLSYNSLEKVANHLKCNSKTEVLPDMWLSASLDGCRKSMDYIVEHCVQDVLVLEQVVSRLKGYASVINSYGSGF